MKHLNWTLTEAFHWTKSKRLLVDPNLSFIRQLRRYECSITGAQSSTLLWDDIPTQTSSLLDWMKTNSILGKEKNCRMTHNWLSAATKRREFSIPPEKMEEFFSEYAKAYCRGEELKVCEVRSDPTYWMYLDLDIKCRTGEGESASVVAGSGEGREGRGTPSLQEVVGYFLPGIVRVCLTEFPDWREAEARFVVSGAQGKVEARMHHPDVNWKYGYHLVWPGVEVTKQRHERFVQALIRFFESQEKEFERNEKRVAEEGKEKEAEEEEKEKEKEEKRSTQGAIPRWLRKHNKWEEVFDLTAFSTTDTLRMLYSSKAVPCRNCKQPSNQPQKKRHGKGGGRKKDRGGGGGGAGSKGTGLKGGKVCEVCEGSGWQDKRLYELLGAYSCLGDSLRVSESEVGGDGCYLLPKETEELMDTEKAPNKITSIRKRVEATSIIKYN